MTSAAFITLSFENTVTVVIRSDHGWEASDPHAMLNEDSGAWTFGTSTGTFLNGATETQVALVGWKLSSAHVDEKGTAYRYPGNQNEVGGFVVTQIID